MYFYFWQKTDHHLVVFEQKSVLVFCSTINKYDYNSHEVIPDGYLLSNPEKNLTFNNDPHSYLMIKEPRQFKLQRINLH